MGTERCLAASFAARRFRDRGGGETEDVMLVGTDPRRIQFVVTEFVDVVSSG